MRGPFEPDHDAFGVLRVDTTDRAVADRTASEVREPTADEWERLLASCTDVRSWDGTTSPPASWARGGVCEGGLPRGG